jgi:hypothetical protein
MSSKNTDATDDQRHRLTPMPYKDGWRDLRWCTLCGYTEAEDHAGRLVAIDSQERPIQPVCDMVARLGARCSNPARRVLKKPISREQDFGAFVAEMTLIIEAANPTGWPFIKARFYHSFGLTQAMFRLDPHTTNHYIVETDRSSGNKTVATTTLELFQ